MATVPAGNEWLKAHFILDEYSFTHASYIGNNPSFELTSKGNIAQVYGPRYAVDHDEPLLHVEFSLKYDDLNLDFLKAVFARIAPEEVNVFINQTPSGRYARKTGFLYEFLTGTHLSPENAVSGNYVDLLDREKYVTGKVTKNGKWRINDNLLGNAAFCPMVRKTKILHELIKKNVGEKIEGLKKEFPQDIFKRAIYYLYTKETRSSFEIEKEQPTPERMERFIAVLNRAGTKPTTEVLAEQNLIILQNIIVDPRFAAKAFRDFQNYIGETLPNYEAMVHYICPPPAILHSLMTGLSDCAEKTAGVDANVRAAVIAFGFVFIHPFEDGNGRIHRYLVHDVLAHDGIVPEGVIIPVSAHMLNHIKSYDQALEAYSRPLMQRAKFTTNENGAVRLTEPQKVEGYFRYPDLTAQCIYLLETIHATLAEDVPGEMLFLLRYDEAKRELQQIVDMPDKAINLMLIFLHQNHGIFPKRRRKDFEKLTDAEIQNMQDAYRRVFELEKI